MTSTSTAGTTTAATGPVDAPMLVGGEDVPAVSGAWVDVTSPHDRSLVGRAPRGAAEDVDRAVAAARAAFPAWRATPPRARGRMLQLAADALEAVAEDVARTISRENGNALRTQSRGEAAYGVDVLRYFGGLAGESKGRTVPLGEKTLDYSRQEPYGVVGAVVPWNAPVQLACMKIASAVSMGNTLVLKAAEDAPLAVLLVARTVAAHLPPGVLNVVTGYGDEAGEALTGHPGVDKLSFTGSTATGSRVMARAAERIVPVSLELGGKNPQVVFPDVAGEEWVVEGVTAAMRFVRQGQSCTAGSRLYLHRSVFDDFVERFSRRLERFVVGDPLDEATDIGAIVSERQYDRVCGYLREGLQEQGAVAVTGGLPADDDPLSGGFYVRPTVLTGVDQGWRVAREEVFGPVVVAIPWDDEEEVVAMANDSHYGLSAFVWTKDLGAGLRTANALEAGWVQVNQGGGQVMGQPYGGWKRSGIGREFSVEGAVEAFTQTKHVSVDLTH